MTLNVLPVNEHEIRGDGEASVVWMKAKAASEYSGISTKLLYAAVRRGQLRAAPIGTGRNKLFCAEWLDEYLVDRAANDGGEHSPV